MTEPSLAVLVIDTSVLVNFLQIDRMDLIRDLSSRFLVTDHAAGEISDAYGEQRARFDAALAAECCEVCRVESDAALEIFGRLTGIRRLGIGESATIAHALSIGAGVALDDRRAANAARRIDERLVILKTERLMVQMIHEGLLSVATADAIKED